MTREGLSTARPRPSPADFQIFLLSATLALLMRLPFLGAGYGADPDSWRVAWAARVIGATGHYEASRFPGYPLHELASSLIWKGGPLALNGVSALIGALGAGFFALTLRRLGSRNGLLASLAMASTPVVFIAGVSAMDYSWSLGFALAGLDFALRRRPLVAGVLGGLAIASRLTSAAWLLPLGLALAHASPPGARRRPALVLATTALAVGTLGFLPVFLTYGAGFFRYYPHRYPEALLVLKNATVDVWGIPGFVALVLAAGPRLVRGRRAPRQPSIPRTASPLLLGACGSGLALFLVAYLRLPFEAAYLVPAVPLTLLLLGQLLERRAFIACCVALLLSPWVLKVSQPGGADRPSPGTGAVAFQALGRPFVLDSFRGPLLTDHARRVQSMRYVERSLARALRLDGRNVVIASDWLPQIRVRLGGKVEGRVEYVYLLTAAELRSLRERGARVWYLSGADWESERVNGVALREHGARPLDSVD